MLPVGPTVKGADVALKCLTDDSNFITESSKRKTIFKDMFVSGEAVMPKLSPHTYRRYRRTRTRMDLQEFERQVCIIKNRIDADCFFRFRAKRFYSFCLMLLSYKKEQLE